jgi:asparagine synthase (glutamine-hydrolysing)
MCGIAGFLDGWRGATYNARGVAQAMGDAVRHRGPDDGDVWVDQDAGIGLAHRRLSIVDLSPLGHQPMLSRSGRYVISYNGEVFNFQELREELRAAGCSFKGGSDTEVIVEACEAWGVEATVRRLIGMFAFALWDCREQQLHLVRDRLGIKPLYWSLQNSALIFGSELKSLKCHPGWQGDIDRAALASFMQYGYIPAPRSIYRGVHKLGPGRILTMRRGGAPTEETYWNMSDTVARGRADRLDVSDEEAVAQLDALLRDAVSRRMAADVPLGAFLSGGIDSSTVVGLMQAQSSKPVRTFSIGFREGNFDEAAHARAVATHLETDHTEFYVEPSHALDVIPKLPVMFDEPFADPSQIPTFLLSELTRRSVTVSLSGDGGDELFAGYSRYAIAQSMSAKLGWVSQPLKAAASRSITLLPISAWDKLHDAAPRLPTGDRMHKLANVLTSDPDALYRQLLTHWHDPSSLVLGAATYRDPLISADADRLTPDRVERMQYIDAVTYLPDDILVKVDRASMAVALEARVPLLDHRVVEFAWRLPMHLKVRDGQAKWLLRQVLHRYVPRELVERPKMGFGVPIDSWLRGPLRDWAEDLLSESRLRAEGYLNPEPIRTKWKEHLTGTRNWQYALWNVLMFQAWLAHEPTAVRSGGEASVQPALH